jgi:hypothetical protein
MVRLLTVVLLSWLLGFYGTAALASGYFTGGNLTTLGGAASGANSDITSLSGLTTPLTRGQGGTGTPFGGTSLSLQTYGFCTPNAFNTTMNSAGGLIVSPALTGTASGATDNNAIYINCASAASTNAQATWNNTRFTRSGHKTICRFSFRTGAAGDLVNVRLRAGIYANTATPFAATAIPNQSIEVSYLTESSDTAFFRIRGQAGGVTETPIVTTAAVTADTHYDWICDQRAGAATWYYSINGGAWTLAGTNVSVPAAATDQYAAMGVSTTENVAKNWKFAGFSAVSGVAH